MLQPRTEFEISEEKKRNSLFVLQYSFRILLLALYCYKKQKVFLLRFGELAILTVATVSFVCFVDKYIKTGNGNCWRKLKNALLQINIWNRQSNLSSPVFTGLATSNLRFVLLKKSGTQTLSAIRKSFIAHRNMKCCIKRGLKNKQRYGAYKHMQS